MNRLPVRLTRRAILCLLILAILAAGAPGTPAQECPPGDLLSGVMVQAQGATGDAARIVDGRLADEGSAPDGGFAVTSRQAAPFLFADLGRPRTLNAFVLQADQNDYYSVEGSVDGAQWFGFWRASPLGSGPGLRQRSARLPRPGRARYLRIRGEGGDRNYAVSEFRAYCTVPSPWPPPVATAPAAEAWLGDRAVRAVKALVALAGLVVFTLGAQRRRRHPESAEPAFMRPLLVGLALVAGLCWWNLGTFNAGRFIHDWEHYHYYIGAKYFDELDYTRLYECTAVADAEDGLASAVAERKIRDLATNRIESAAGTLANPERCKQNFSAARWEAFRGDIAWFRGQVSPTYWARSQLDHGYNATPLWTALGSILARAASPASRGTVMALALIDPLLLVLMWAMVLRTFGLRATAAALIWWGTNQVADFSWNGGAFLRQDWLMLSVTGVCAVRAGRPGWGGFALAWATLLRVFPGFLVAALIVQTLARMIRDRRVILLRDEWRFAAGAAAGLVVLGAVSLGAVGTAGWAGFVENTRVHLESHGTNTLGLQPVLAYEHASRLEAVGDPTLADPFRDWNAARDRVLDRRRPLAGVALLAFVALLAWTVRRQGAWVAMILGIGFIPFTSAQSCYYYSILLGYGLLVDREHDAVGALLCALSLASLAAAAVFQGPAVMDQRFAAMSLALVVFVPTATWLVARHRTVDSPAPDAGEAPLC